MVLASADAATDLQTLAEIADKVMEVATPTVAATSATDSLAEVRQLREEVAHFADLVATLTRSQEQHRYSGNSYRRRHRSHSPVPKNEQSQERTLCWYHKKFGEAAKKCQDPCTWGNA